MYSKSAMVINNTGLHARPASEFVKEAKKYQSKITIVKEDGSGISANAKSIVAVLSLCAAKGTSIIIQAEGPDETAAVDALTILVGTGFGE